MTTNDKSAVAPVVPQPPAPPSAGSECTECREGHFELRTGTNRTIPGRGGKPIKIPDERRILTCSDPRCDTMHVTDEDREALAHANGFPRASGYLTVSEPFATLTKHWRDAWDNEPQSVTLDGERYFVELNGFAGLALRDDAALPPSKSKTLEDLLQGSAWLPVDVLALVAWLREAKSNEVTCERCKGKGRPPVNCDCCEGASVIDFECKDPHCHRSHEVTCPTCDGSGLRGGCPRCKGEHVVWAQHGVSIFGVNVAPTIVLRVLEHFGRDDLWIAWSVTTEGNALLLRGPGWRFAIMRIHGDPVATYAPVEAAS